MPQTDLYLCETDVLAIGRSFFARGAKIVPALDYSTPVTLEISTDEQLKDTLRDSDLSFLFIISPEWERSPLVIRSVKKDTGEAFYVSQKEGGPTLNLFYAQPREVAGILATPPGFISYHERFWNPISNRNEQAPAPLSTAYRAVISSLKRGSQVITRSHRKLIVTKNTLTSGLKLIDLKKHVHETPKLIDPSVISANTD